MLVSLVILDLRFSRRINRGFYDRIWGSWAWLWVIGLILAISFIDIQSEEAWRWNSYYVSSIVILILTLLLYLLRRRRFKKLVLTEGGEAVTNFSEGLAPRLRLIWDSTGVLLTWIWCVIIFTIGLHKLLPYLRVFNSDLGEIILSVAFASFLMLGLIWRATRNYPEGFLNILGLIVKGKSFLKLVMVPAFLGAGLAFFSAWIILTRKSTPMTPLNEVLSETHSAGLLVGFIFMAIVMAPFFEEIIFRGYFFYVLRRFKGDVFAVVIVALIFSSMHVGQYWGDWLAIGVVTLLGFVLTFIRLWSESTVASIVIHYLYNTGVTIIPIVFLVFSNPAYFQYQSQYEQLTFSKKEELLSQSIHKMPQFSEAYNDLAWLYAEEGRSLEKGLDLINKGLQLDPERDDFWDTKAELLHKLGRNEEARGILKRLVKENPDDKEFKKHLEEIKKF